MVCMIVIRQLIVLFVVKIHCVPHLLLGSPKLNELGVNVSSLVIVKMIVGKLFDQVMKMSRIELDNGKIYLIAEVNNKTFKLEITENDTETGEDLIKELNDIKGLCSYHWDLGGSCCP